MHAILYSGHAHELRRILAIQPQAPALRSVEEFLGADEASQILGGVGLLPQEGVPVRRAKQQMAAVIWHAAEDNLRHRTHRLAPGREHAIRAGHKIRTDVRRLRNRGNNLTAALLIRRVGAGRRNRFILIESLRCEVERAEADDNHVDVGLALGFAFPRERPVRKMNFDSLFEQGARRTPTCSPWVMLLVETNPTRIRLP